MLAYPIAMGLAIVYCAEHYVIDVLLGWVYAGAVMLACGAWERQRDRRRPVRAQRDSEATEPSADADPDVVGVPGRPRHRDEPAVRMAEQVEPLDAKMASNRLDVGGVVLEVVRRRIGRRIRSPRAAGVEQQQRLIGADGRFGFPKFFAGSGETPVGLRHQRIDCHP
jgi:hypothetical protein